MPELFQDGAHRARPAGAKRRLTSPTGQPPAQKRPPSHLDMAGPLKAAQRMADGSDLDRRGFASADCIREIPNFRRMSDEAGVPQRLQDWPLPLALEHA